MTLKLNTNDTDITVYDKSTIKHATGKEIVPFLSTVKGDFKEQLINIISRMNNLSTNCIDIYRYIIYNYKTDNNISIKELINKVVNASGRSAITYKRSIDTLVLKGVVKRDSVNGFIKLRKEFDINAITECAKYFVIELPNTISTNDKGAYIAESTVEGSSSVGGKSFKGVGGSGEMESCSFVR